jgi:hypothetical protein
MEEYNDVAEHKYKQPGKFTLDRNEDRRVHGNCVAIFYFIYDAAAGS